MRSAFPALDEAKELGPHKRCSAPKLNGRRRRGQDSSRAPPRAPLAAFIPTRRPIRLEDDRVTPRSTVLLVLRDVPLADLASALDLSVPTVRQNLDRGAARLEEIVFTLTDDASTVQLWLLAGRQRPLVGWPR